MAGEIQLAYGTAGRTLYAVVRNATGSVWNGAAFVAYNGANWTAYDVALAEQGSSGYYVGDFPVVAAGVYQVEVRDQAGGSPATTDTLAGAGSVEWDGTAVLPLSGLDAKLNTIDTVVDSILALVGTSGVTISTATAQAIATTLLDLANGVEAGQTPRQALRLILAGVVGLLSGAETDIVRIRDTNDTVDRIVADVDQYGNRTSVTLNAG